MSIQILAMWTGVKIAETAHEGLDRASVGTCALCGEHLAYEGFSLDMSICPCLNFAFSQEATFGFELGSCVPEVHPSTFPLQPDGR